MLCTSRRSFLATAAAATSMGVLPLWPGWSQAEATRRRVLYISSRLNSRTEAVIRDTVEALGPTGFNVAILAFLYARHGAGGLKLTLNGTAPEHLHPHLPRYLRRLRRGFPTRKRILISIGGWGNRSTFDAIRAAGVSRFLVALDEQLVAPLGLEGIDLDLEPSTVAENTPAGWHAVHDEFGALLVELTNGYMARHPDHLVTHAPIASVAADLYVNNGTLRGVRGSLFQACRQAGAGNNISWLNVQFYEAGDPRRAPSATPKTDPPPTADLSIAIADFYQQQLVTPLLAQAGATGVAQPWEVLVPGFEPRYHEPIEVCRNTLRALTRAPGYFLWDYRQVAPAMAAWGEL